MGKIDRIYYLLISIISILFVLDLFIAGSIPATMDGLIHVASIAQFSDALSQLNFPVIWLNNFANYGLPVGIFSHQLPIYLGAILNLIINNPVLSTNIVTFFGILFSNVLAFKFLKIYFPAKIAFFSTVLFALAPYRILNVFIRGAVPETFSLIFLPLILISLHRLLIERDKDAFFLLTLGFLGLSLTHPMMLIIYGLMIVPFIIFLLLTRDKKYYGASIVNNYIYPGFIICVAGIISIGIASYYFLPLLIEKKYFYFGHNESLFNSTFLGINNFIDVRWYYSFANDIFTRGHVLQVGLIETLLLLAGVLLAVRESLFKKGQNYLLFLSVFVGLLTVFFLLPISSLIYSIITPLQNIQFPWRMLSVFVIVPPLIFAILMQKFKRDWIFISIIAVVILTRTPQLFGKNYTDYPTSFYHSTKENLHSINMNTLWTGKTEDYPIRTRQSEIIEGKGSLVNNEVKNISRSYSVSALTPLRIIDYTFYFPGWNVFIDNKPVPIQFQDPEYRGVITYSVPVGQHEAKVVFQDTQVRKVAKVISVCSAFFLLLLFLLRKKVLSRVYKYV